MAQTILKGYLINKIDYLINDEVITFIDEAGTKYTCLSLGSRKLESKNGRNLFLGNFCEFEFFMARSINKMSKLKSCHTIESCDWHLSLSSTFNLLCKCANHLNEPSKYNFLFFKNMLNLIKSNHYSEKTIYLIILQKFCVLNGIGLEVNHCIECGSNKLKTINFKKRGMVCNACFDIKKDHLFDLNISKLFYHLFNENYDQLAQYSIQMDLCIKMLVNYINDNLGVFL